MFGPRDPIRLLSSHCERRRRRVGPSRCASHSREYSHATIGLSIAIQFIKLRRRPKTTESGLPPVMPGLEPGIQAAPSVGYQRTSALDTRVKPVYDEAETAVFIFGRRLNANIGQAIGPLAN